MFQLYRQTGKGAVDCGTVFGTNAEAVKRAASIARREGCVFVLDTATGKVERINGQGVTI